MKPQTNQRPDWARHGVGAAHGEEIAHHHRHDFGIRVTQQQRPKAGTHYADHINREAEGDEWASSAIPRRPLDTIALKVSATKDQSS